MIFNVYISDGRVILHASKKRIQKDAYSNIREYRWFRHLLKAKVYAHECAAKIYEENIKDIGDRWQDILEGNRLTVLIDLGQLKRAQTSEKNQ